MTTCKNKLCSIVKTAQKEPVFIKRHGNTCGVILGFKDEDDALDWKLENDPRFLKLIENRRKEKTVDFPELHE